MVKEVKRLSLFPFILFLLFSLVFFLIFYSVLQNYLKKEIVHIQNKILNIEKNYLKKEVKNFKKTVNFIVDVSYSLVSSNLEIFLKTLVERNLINDFYISKDNYVLFGKIPKNVKFKYEIYNNKYILLNLRNNKYLVFLINKGDDVFIAGLNKKYIDSLILEKIRNYLDKINKDTLNYIALGKIVTFHPKKDGIFGYVYYMPPPLREKEGLYLSINSPDAKGNYFRKKYFECLKENRDCFVKYYFKNPKTGKIEEKISYFSLIKPFNLSIVKGIYVSQIFAKIHKEIMQKQKELKTIILISIIIYLLIMIIYFFVLRIFVHQMQSKIFKEYESLLTKLKYKHYFDSLTGLPNRNKLIENVHQYKSLIMLDIDDFSDINDVYGFFIGNKLLRKVAGMLKENFQYVYRIGSDEFAIGFNKKISNENLCEIANKELEYDLIKITFTVGGSNEEHALLRTAESALKVAKKERKNCILFDNKLEEIHKNRIRTIQKLRKVLEKEKIIPFYQCIVGKETKYEALMRIEIDGKILTPFAFMDLLKEAKLYCKFSQIMIKKVFEDIKEGKINNVSINVSFIDIVDEETRNFIYDLLNKCKKNYLITFEILESESITNFKCIKEFIKEVKNKDVKIAIDDFGSGYSNFVRILELNPDFIKIDGSLIKNIEDKKYFEIVKLIVDFAKKFNIEVVAEFVENEKIYNILKELGVDYFQGYYFCKPQSLENIKKLS